MAAWIPSDGGVSIAVRAARMSMAQVVVVILAAVVTLGGAITAAAITHDVIGGQGLGVRRVALIAIPVVIVGALVVLWLIRRSTRRYDVRIDPEGVRVASDRGERAFAWRDIDRLAIRTDSDYARVSVRGRTGSVTIMPGLALASVRGGSRDAMDPVPPPVIDAIRDQGLAHRGPTVRAPGLHRFRRG